MLKKQFKDIIKYPIKYKLFAAEQLLILYNDTWTEGEVIDRKEFVSRMILESIVLYVYYEIDYSCAIYYQDGDLFAGHSIVICTDPKGKLEYAEIAG